MCQLRVNSKNTNLVSPFITLKKKGLCDASALFLFFQYNGIFNLLAREDVRRVTSANERARQCLLFWALLVCNCIYYTQGISDYLLFSFSLKRSSWVWIRTEPCHFNQIPRTRPVDRLRLHREHLVQDRRNSRTNVVWCESDKNNCKQYYTHTHILIYRLLWDILHILYVFIIIFWNLLLL